MIGKLVVALTLLFMLFVVYSAQAQTETVLYNFCSRPNCSDGDYPTSRLTSDGAGNFYGTTSGGGLGYGTVFELSPNGSGGWNETVLYSFTGGADGWDPVYAYVTFDLAGNLYGTTLFGGDSGCDNGTGCGVVFELSPMGTSWTETVLHSFTLQEDGGFPEGGVIIDPEGNIYGGNELGVFELSPSGGDWTAQLIYEGFITGGGVTMDASGNIFGGTWVDEKDGRGTVFELSPNGTGGWNPTVIHNFLDGNYPTGALVFDKAGNVYGTISGTPCCREGKVYKLSPGKNGTWMEKTLYSFKAETDGRYIFAGIVFDAVGNIYGTTAYGGGYGDGVIFELVPVGRKGTSYEQKVLWNFNGTDGAQPFGSLILDSAGNLYGTTSGGGSNGYGVVFEVTP